MIRVLLEPSFEWENNSLWREARSSLAQSSSLEITEPPVGIGSHAGFRRFGAVVLDSELSFQEPPVPPDLNQLTSHPEFAQFEKVFTALLRRENNYGELRDVDVEVLLYGLLVHFAAIVKDCRPHLVLFPVTPHSVETYSLWFVSRALGAKTLWFQPCSMAPVMLPREHFTRALEVEPRFATLGAKHEEVVAEILKQGTQRAQSLADPTYISRQAAIARLSFSLAGKLRALRASVGWLVKERYQSRFLFNQVGLVHTLVRRFLQVYQPRSNSNLLRDNAARFSKSRSLEKPFALFALHYEPERTSVPEGGDDVSQLRQILRARDSLPKGMDFCVKEHPSQLSPALQGYKGRSPHFYELLVSRLGLKLDVGTQMRDLVKSANVVFTGTGNVAIEATMAGVPVVYFGNPWWEGMPGTYPFSSFSKRGLPEAGLQPSDSRSVEAFLKARISEMIPGGASESETELAARFGVDLGEFSPVGGQNVARFIESHCKKVAASHDRLA